MLNSFCRELGLAVIVDEVFLDYGLKTSGAKTSAQEETNHGAALPRIGQGDGLQGSFAGNQEVLTFTLSGLSKVAALPQMKVAWVVTSGPRELQAAALGRLEVIADTYLSMNAPIQWAVPTLLEQRKSVRSQLLQRVTENLREMDRQLAGQTNCQRLCVEGGWYAVLRVPVTRSDEELAIELAREKAVLVHPGHFYDFPKDGYLVLSLITPRADFASGFAAALDKLNL